MSTPEEILREALAAHLAGQFAAAEVGYRKVLNKRPADHQALYGLGVINFDAGAREIGIDLLLRSLQAAPDNGVAWHTLGGMYVATGRAFEGKLAHQRATEVSPEVPETWYGLAVSSIAEHDLEAAVQQLRRALACPAPLTKAYELLAATLKQLGRQDESAQTIADWLRHEPTNPLAQRMAVESPVAVATGLPADT